MQLRVLRGTVFGGRENDFVTICRRQVAGNARSAGLASFFVGYRRIEGADKFLMASLWDTPEVAERVAGEPQAPRLAEVMQDVASVESVDVYEGLEPVYRGIVDVPGGVIRVTRASVSDESLNGLLAWLRTTSRDRSISGQRLLLGWAMGRRAAPGGSGNELIAVTAWPSPLVIEAVAEPGRAGMSMFSAVDDFVTDQRVEQFQAIGLELPEALNDVGSRRVIAARFITRAPADASAHALAQMVSSAGDAKISVAPLGAPGTPPDAPAFVLVARVSIGEYGRAERLIADNGGEVILTQAEPTARPAAAPSTETETDTADQGGAGWTASFAPAPSTLG